MTTLPARLRGPAQAGRALLRYWRAGPLWATIVALVALLHGFTPVATGWALKELVDVLSHPAGGRWSPAALVGGWALLAAVAALGGPVSRFASRELARRLEFAGTDALLAAVSAPTGIGHLQQPAYQDRLRLGQQGGAHAPAEVATISLDLLRTLLTVGGLVALVAATSPTAAALILCSALPALLAQLRVSDVRQAAAEGTAQSRRRQVFYTSLLFDGRAAQEIRLLGLTGFFRARMAATFQASHRQDRHADAVASRTDSVLAAAGVIVVAAATYLTVRQVQRGSATAGDVALVLSSAASMQAVLAATVAQLAHGRQTLAMFDHFTSLTAPLAAAPAIEPSTSHGSSRPQPRTGLLLRDVWFRYDGSERWALSGLNLAVPAGQAIALVGRNGSGKSTLVKLLLRLYEPDKGSITWDGIDLRDMPVDALRRRVGVLFQDFMMYDLSAADNIAVGDLGQRDDPAALALAARRAGIADTLAALPQGYDTMLSRHFANDDSAARPTAQGVLLSGGQWQRVALARTLLRGDADLVILDEPSAGLDPEAEASMHRTVAEHRQGRTSLLISHRLNTVADADTIVVLADGSVVEQGSHHELLAAQGTYAKLFTMQAAGYQSSTVAARPRRSTTSERSLM